MYNHPFNIVESEEELDPESRIKKKSKIYDEDLHLAFNAARHIEKILGLEWKTQTWRMKERMKTVSVALVLCLNVGVDPPDIVKTQPCAKLECWIDPATMPAPKALETIGQTLQTQYERWQPRARYKLSLDPTSDEVKKLCLSLRRNAKEERVLFHYNGHGVPKPTNNGEIWVFNRTYTQYIPLSIYDLQTWMGSPSIYVYDCSNAGIIVESFKTFAEQHKSEYEQSLASSTPSCSGPSASPPFFSECIQLAACAANEQLPMNPQLPADLFTACLTTPIKIALRWCVLKSTSKLIPKVTLDMIDKVPGIIPDRKSMYGELNWIFTAITDTIAWNTLPKDLFQKLFRQDLLVASLFRNFLLAERIMRSCGCTPVSSPILPPTFQHPMWDAWDLVLDLCLGQLPKILSGESYFRNLPFFEEQLTAFEVWLKLNSQNRRPPEQLPIVLQVLLSQVHRTRALDLLGRFLDLGPWAVNLALSVGISPYVLKLLQSSAKELRPLLVYIWAKILAVDNTCQADLIREQGHRYFLAILAEPFTGVDIRIQATFVLSCLVSNYRDGQEAALQGSLISICLEQLGDQKRIQRKWLAICLGKLWDHYESARWTGVRDTAPEKLFKLLSDKCPEVRAAAVYALGTFINSVSIRSEHANNIDHAIAMTLVNHAIIEASPLVRKEIINALQWLVLAFDVVFAAVASKEGQYPTESQTSNTLPRITNRDKLGQPDGGTFRRIPSSPTINNTNSPSMTNSYSGSLGTLPGLGYGSVYMKIWMALCQLENDPYPEVSDMCLTVTGYIRSLVKEQRELIDSRHSSMSLPPSPNRGMYLSGESPPTLHPSGDFNTKLNRSAVANRSRKKKDSIDETANAQTPVNKQPLVSTNFVAWSSKFFLSTIQRVRERNDTESQQYYERDWRILRNNKIREEAFEEQCRVQASVPGQDRVETQLFHTRTVVPPSVIQLHPFNQQIAVAGNDSFAIWDWGTGAKTTVQQQKSAFRGRTSKVTALEWINGHDASLLAVAADDGAIRIWKPNVGTCREPTLISAWQAFNDFKYKKSGVVLSWEQWTHTVITTGDTRVLRFWDVQKEMKALDISTGTDAPVTCVDSFYSGPNVSMPQEPQEPDLMESPRETKSGLAVIGCADGSVRVFDRRCGPQDTRVRSWIDLNEPILAVQMFDHSVIYGSRRGVVKVYDMRKNSPMRTNPAVHDGDLSCMAIHRNAKMYLCGSPNQFINIVAINGTVLNTVRSYEGFMGQRIGPVTCVNFHPLRVVWAAGTSDCCVNVYGMSRR